MNKDAQYLRDVADLTSFEHIREIADKYERMKHDLDRHVKIAATIGDAEETAYRQGWLDGSAQVRLQVREALHDYRRFLPVSSQINERLKRQKSE